MKRVEYIDEVGLGVIRSDRSDIMPVRVDLSLQTSDFACRFAVFPYNMGLCFPRNTEFWEVNSDQ